MIAVASFTGAWIETRSYPKDRPPIKSHPLRVRGLKLFQFRGQRPVGKSHPLRVRGLKQKIIDRMEGMTPSHPLRVRGLKHIKSAVPSLFLCRILYGCVD